MPNYIDGVRINDREAWLEHKKKIELNKCLAQVACALPHPRQ